MAQQIPDYLDWFHFTEPPFSLLPDLDFFYPSRSHKQALEVLRYGIARGEGFMVLSGQAGTGKTMLLRLLLNELPQEKQAAFIVTPAVSPKGLMSLLLEELGLEVGQSRGELALMLKDFQEHVLSLAEKNQSLLIVVDEAQDLPIETVEQLRLLSNIETGKKKLIQILLVGQPEIRRLLDDPRLCQLTQRIVINETLSPLNRQETADYVKFRLAKAGRPDMELSSALQSIIYKNSGGLPRLINRLMDRTLLMAAASGAQNISVNHLQEALSTLPRPASLRRPSFIRVGNLRYGFSWALFGSVAGVVLCFLLLNAGNLMGRFTSVSPAFRAEQQKHNNDPLPANSFQVRVAVRSARIHIAPFKRSKILSIAKEGTVLMALEKQGPWIKVQLSDKNGRKVSGWLLKKQVESNFSAANTLSRKKMGHRTSGTRQI